MARIVLSTFGSTGDLNPFIALGLVLRERKHEVIFAVQDLFAPVVANQGFVVRHLSGNVVAALAEHGASRLGASNAIPSLQGLVRYGILPTLEAQIGELADACRDADLLVTSYGQLAGTFVVGERSIPWATVALSPVSVPSAHIASQPLPFQLPDRLQPAANRLQWRLGSLILRWIADRPLNQVRAGHHLPPLRESLWLGAASRQLVCVACSPAFQPQPPDWPRYVHMTGFCFWDDADSWEVPPELETFRQDQRPYIVVTAGSVASPLGDAFAGYFHTSVQAILSLGARALVIGESRPSSREDDDRVLHLPFAPYSRILPGAAAVIHHGGMGTTAQALRSGVPSLIVPWGVDQFYTASQMTRTGAGHFLYWRRYIPERARETLRSLVNDSRFRARARALGDAVAHEDGASTLGDAVLALLSA